MRGLTQKNIMRGVAFRKNKMQVAAFRKTKMRVVTLRKKVGKLKQLPSMKI